MVIPNIHCMFVDSDHGHNLQSHKLVSGVMAEICAVLVNWYMGNQTCIAAHSTYTESFTFYYTVKMNKYLSLVDEWLCLSSKNATIIWEDN